MLYSPVRHFPLPEGSFSFDLHVWGTPPAFVLSQDQTLRCQKYMSDTLWKSDLTHFTILVLSPVSLIMPKLNASPSRAHILKLVWNFQQKSFVENFCTKSLSNCCFLKNQQVFVVCIYASINYWLISNRWIASFALFAPVGISLNSLTLSLSFVNSIILRRNHNAQLAFSSKAR